MSYGSEKLQELGVQRIHDDTHISIQHINIVLNEEFENINKVQFMGFISILEREYDIDLSDIRDNGLEYYKSDANTYNGEPGVFVVVGKHKTFKYFYIVLAFIVFIFAMYFTMNYETQKSSVVVENKIIDEVKKNIESVQDGITPEKRLENSEITKKDTPSLKKKSQEETLVPSEKTSSLAVKSNKEIKVEVLKKEESKAPQVLPEKSADISPLVVEPRSKLWIGYVDISHNKKYQKIITEPLVLDAHTKWLLFLGHGNVNIEVNGIVNEYRTKKSMRFIYKEGKLKKVTTEEFKKLNRGRKW